MHTKSKPDSTSLFYLSPQSPLYSTSYVYKYKPLCVAVRKNRYRICPSAFNGTNEKEKGIQKTNVSLLYFFVALVQPREEEKLAEFYEPFPRCACDGVRSRNFFFRPSSTIYTWKSVVSAYFPFFVCVVRRYTGLFQTFICPAFICSKSFSLYGLIRSF